MGGFSVYTNTNVSKLNSTEAEQHSKTSYFENRISWFRYIDIYSDRKAEIFRIAQIGNSSNSMDNLEVIQVIFLRNWCVKVSIVFI